MRIGIDIGRVIINGDGDDTKFLAAQDDEEALRAPEVAKAGETIERIVRLVGRPNVFLVSKCGARIQILTRRWLQRQTFMEFTGMDPCHLVFCLRREDKAKIAKQLKLDVFVDDRLDVLEAMPDVPLRMQFGVRQVMGRIGIMPAPSWEMVEWFLQRELRPAQG